MFILVKTISWSLTPGITLQAVTPEVIDTEILTVWLYHIEVHTKDADGLGNSVDPDQTNLQGLHHLLRSICPNSWGFYGNNF